MSKTKITTQPLYLDLQSVAAALCVSPSTVQNLVRAGDFPQPRKLSGNRVGWLMRELTEWSEARPVSDIPPPPNTGAKKPRARRQPPATLDDRTAA